PSCKTRLVVPLGSKETVCACGAGLESLFTPLIKEGRVVADLPGPRAIREGVLRRLEGLEL
ncbi:MAG: hypothetical protein AAB307_07085, partial [Deltaproteobacteria bacterium]